MDAQRFADFWQGATSLKEVADRVGCSSRTASQRASRMRRRGVALKRFTPTTEDVVLKTPEEAATEVYGTDFE